MNTKETRLRSIAKLALVYGLMAVALWWTWTVGKSFVNLCMSIYKHLGPQVVFEGACLFYVVIAFASMMAVYAHIQTYPPHKVTPRIRLYRKIELTWALIPGLNMLIPLAFMCWAIVQAGLKGAAFIIVLFETVFKKEEQA